MSAAQPATTSSGMPSEEGNPTTECIVVQVEATNQVGLSKILELFREAATHITQMNERTKHRGEALSALNSLLDGISNYACNRLASLEDKVVEIHTAITKTEAIITKMEKTWAQIAASGAIATTAKAKPTIGPEKVQQREQAKREREQYKVTLNANSANDETRVLIDKEHAKVIKVQFQKAMDKVALPSAPKIVSINKLPRNTIRLQFKTTD
jgi:uncharacterized protein YpmB